ncbi:hypothetical protein [Chitinophaga defluvii]|uniref:XRE family transcriptional regulator n=1 Tax=Chitinophaga defluvii TaxID=3163343 RepID=A0ABV2TAW7_9BACT
MMTTIELIIEKAYRGFFGRVLYKNNLIVDEASTIPKLQAQLKKLLKTTHGLKPNEIEFDIKYDLTVLFEKLNYLKISTVANLANINASLLRQYVSGVKFPSPAQAKKIEEAIHQIGEELKGIHINA